MYLAAEAPALLIIIVLKIFEFSRLELSSLRPPLEEREEERDDCLLIGSRVILIPCCI